VSLGLGSVIASTVETAPWLIFVGRQKIAVFISVGVLLVVNYWIAVVRPRRMHCAPGDVCHVDHPAMRANRLMFWTSVAIYGTAVALTYGAVWLRIQP
jgi:hypothetical protein